MNDFNQIAWMYDWLARLVFQGNILKSQCQFLYLIEPNSSVLIVGGGSGKVLEAINNLNIPIKVDFIEPSDRMIEKARKRSSRLSNLEIVFHQIRLQSYNSIQKYDCVCCFYFLDLFKRDKLREILILVKSLMGNRGHLLVADFQNRKGKIWQKVLSSIMHAFFKLTAGLESRKLKSIDNEVIKGGFQKHNEAYFFLEFIFSAVYKK